MAEFYNISDWQEKSYFQTGGTRNKSIVENPNDGNIYFFKTSLKKENKDYKYEFWSEIIASEIGIALGFNILKYDIALKGDIIGCISMSMVNTEENTLSEGIKYLKGYDNSYDPTDRKMQNKYTFSFIQKALAVYNHEDKIEDIIKTIIFDSLIGNGDRHQENWGIITPAKKLRKGLKFKSLFKNVVKEKYAPIYDNGSCLGRELSDETVDKMLEDDKELILL